MGEVKNASTHSRLSTCRMPPQSSMYRIVPQKAALQIADVVSPETRSFSSSQKDLASETVV